MSSPDPRPAIAGGSPQPAVDEVRARLYGVCGALPGTVHETPFGPEVAVFKVNGRMFALVSADDACRLTVKCDPAVAEALRAEHAAITPGYHMNKRHWITITLDGSLAETLVRGLIEDAYWLVLPRRRVTGRPASRPPINSS